MFWHSRSLKPEVSHVGMDRQPDLEESQVSAPSQSVTHIRSSWPKSKEIEKEAPCREAQLAGQLYVPKQEDEEEA